MTRRIRIYVYQDYDSDLAALARENGPRWLSAQMKNALGFYTSGNNNRITVPKKVKTTLQFLTESNTAPHLVIQAWLYNEDRDCIEFLNQVPRGNRSQFVKILLRAYLLKDIADMYGADIHADIPNIQNPDNVNFETPQAVPVQNTEQGKTPQAVDTPISKAETKRENTASVEETENAAASLFSLFGNLHTK